MNIKHIDQVIYYNIGINYVNIKGRFKTLNLELQNLGT